MKNLLAAGLLAFALGLPARADLKIALIDTSKAFDAYYKTKDSAIRIAAKKAAFEKDIQGLRAEYENDRREAQSLEDIVKNTGVPADIRKSKDTALAQKVQDLQSLDQEIERVRKLDSEELKDELVRAHQEIADAMMKVITAYVAAQGYDLVLDKSASAAAVPTLFPYNSGRVIDLTEAVIDKLNASAPSH